MPDNKRVCSVAGCGSSYYAHSDRPVRSEVSICAMHRNVNRWRKCEHCKQPFRAKWSDDPRRYCGYECMGLARRTLPRNKVCAVDGCNELVKVRRASAKYCSLACMGVARRMPDSPRSLFQEGQTSCDEPAEDQPVTVEDFFEQLDMPQTAQTDSVSDRKPEPESVPASVPAAMRWWFSGGHRYGYPATVAFERHFGLPAPKVLC